MTVNVRSLVFLLALASFSCHRKDEAIEGGDEKRGAEMRPGRSGLGDSNPARRPGSGTGKDSKADFASLSKEQLLYLAESSYTPGAIAGNYLEALAELAKRDPVVALETFFTKDRIANCPGFSTVAGALAKTHPEILKSWLSTSLPAMTSDRSTLLTYYSEGLASLAKTSPEDALEIVNTTIHDPTLEERSLQSIFHSLGEIDAGNALEHAKASYTGRQLEQILVGIGAGVAKHQPEKALEIAEGISNQPDRARLIASVFRGWIASDREAAMERLGSISDSDFEKIAKNDFGGSDSIVSTLATEKPEILLQRLGSITPSSANIDLFRRSIIALAPGDQQEALHAIQSLPASAMKTELTESAFNAFAAIRPNPDLIKHLDGGDPKIRTSAIKGFATAIGQNGMSSVLKVADELDASDRPAFLETALSSISQTDVMEAANFAIQENQTMAQFPEAQRSGLIKDMGQRMATADPDAALEWFSRVPVEMQQDAMRGLSREMIRNDVQGFGKWLGEQPRNSAWKEGVKAMVTELNHSDPEMAAQWKRLLDAPER